MVYIISRERLKGLHHVNRMNSKGVFNWFISPKEMLHILVDMDNVTYLYTTPYQDADPAIKTILMPDMEILGIIDDDDIKFKSNVKKQIEAKKEKPKGVIDITAPIHGIQGGEEIIL